MPRPRRHIRGIYASASLKPRIAGKPPPGIEPYPRHLRLGLIEAREAFRRKKYISLYIRGIYASASLKRAVDEVRFLREGGDIRGIYASASLKHDNIAHPAQESYLISEAFTPRPH